MKKIVAGLIILFSMGVALIAFAASPKVDKSGNRKDKPVAACTRGKALCTYRLFMKNGDFLKALDQAEDMAAKKPRDGEAYYRKARALHKLGETVLAIDAYETAMELGYESFYALNNCGLLYMETGHNDKALEKLQAAVAMDGAQAYAFSNLGTVYERMGELAQARDAYQKAVAMAPDYALAKSKLQGVTARLGASSSSKSSAKSSGKK